MTGHLDLGKYAMELKTRWLGEADWEDSGL